MRPSIFANDNPRPVKKILGKRTLWVLAEPDRIESFILEPRGEEDQLGEGADRCASADNR